jgi:uncharacterized SAM-binding protein YcdF (DUF218 family)
MLVLAVLVSALLLLWLGAALILDIIGRRGSAHGIFDLIVVPGCRVLEGGLPSGHLCRRVETAVELWRQGCAPLVLFSGGGEPSEASVAARHATLLGLDLSAVVLEERSRTTSENAQLSAARVKAQRVLLVTDSYHLVRARSTFRHHFPDVEAVAVVAPFRARIRNAVREVLAIGWNLVRRKGG